MSDAAGAANSSTPSPRDRLAADLRGFGPLGILAMLLIAAGQIVAPLSAVLVLLWTAVSRTPWREIGYVRPKSWVGGFAVGIAFGISFKFLMKAAVMPLLGANPTNQAYHFLVGNEAALPGIILTMIIVAGIGEETFFRGYMFPRIHVRTSGQAARTRPNCEDRSRACDIGVVWVASLLRSGARWRRAGDAHGSRIRDNLRDQRAALDADVRSCRFRSDCGRAHLSQSRILGRAPDTQIDPAFDGEHHRSYC